MGASPLRVRAGLLVLAPLALATLACRTAPPSALHPGPRPAGAAASAALVYRPPPPGGASYRLRVQIEGEREVRERERVRATPEAWRFQLDYRELPDPASAPGESETILVLKALRWWSRSGGSERIVEVAEDRLRILRDGEPTLDLDGAHPREALTPRMLLDHPFAGLRYDLRGDPLAILVAGPPPARDLLRSLPLRASLAWTRLAFPEPGRDPRSWSALRSPVGPSARLGLALELRHELAGVDDAGIARVLVRGALQAEGLRSERGLPLDRVRANVRGEARVEGSTSRLRCLRLESDVRISYRRGEPSAPREYHLRHRSRTSLELLGPEADASCRDLESV